MEIVQDNLILSEVVEYCCSEAFMDKVNEYKRYVVCSIHVLPYRRLLIIRSVHLAEEPMLTTSQLLQKARIRREKSMT